MTFLKEQQEMATKWLEPKVTYADRKYERVAKFAEDILGAFWVEQQKDTETLIYQVIQNTRKDFLRSEIKKLEQRQLLNVIIPTKSPLEHALREREHNVLTSIITRYKEELLELEKVV